MRSIVTSRVALLLALALAVCAGVPAVRGAPASARTQALAALFGGGDETARSVHDRGAGAAPAGRLSASAACWPWPACCCRRFSAIPWRTLMSWASPAAQPIGALLAMMAGAAAFAVQSAAFAGAFAAVALVYLLARSGGTSRLLLTGVVIASACGALVSVLLALADNGQLRGMVFWLAGDLGWALSPGRSLIAATLAAVIAIVVARPLNVLAAGELRARSVGLRHRSVAHCVVHRVRVAHRHRGGQRGHCWLRRSDHAARRYG